MDNDYWSRILQLERPHKNYEDNYKDRGFWDPNYRNLSQQKNILAYSRNYIHFAQSPQEHPGFCDNLTS